MTEQTKDNAEQILGVIKLALFPVLLMFVVWYINKLDKRFDRWETDLQEMKINQRVIQRDIQELKVDTGKLQNDVDILKKNLTK